MKVAAFIAENGASFFDEIVDGTHLLRTQVEEALAELVAAGQFISDSFGGLRALLTPPRHHKRRPNGVRLAGAGRWALVKRKAANGAAKTGDAERVEEIALALLRRYGVVFMRILEREASWLPKWRVLLRVYRKLEARGEIWGGRFVSGFSGEQFALPGAVASLRSIRRRAPDDSLISVSGADPLNLAGILTPGPKLAALAGNRVRYRDGIPIAFLEGHPPTRAGRAGDRGYRAGSAARPRRAGRASPTLATVCAARTGAKASRSCWTVRGLSIIGVTEPIVTELIAASALVRGNVKTARQCTSSVNLAASSAVLRDAPKEGIEAPHCYKPALSVQLFCVSR